MEGTGWCLDELGKSIQCPNMILGRLEPKRGILRCLRGPAIMKRRHAMPLKEIERDDPCYAQKAAARDELLDRLLKREITIEQYMAELPEYGVEYNVTALDNAITEVRSEPGLGGIVNRLLT